MKHRQKVIQELQTRTSAWGLYIQAGLGLGSLCLFSCSRGSSYKRHVVPPTRLLPTARLCKSPFYPPCFAVAICSVTSVTTWILTQHKEITCGQGRRPCEGQPGHSLTFLPWASKMLCRDTSTSSPSSKTPFPLEMRREEGNAGCQPSRKLPSGLMAWVRICAETETSLTPVSSSPVSEKAWNKATTLCFHHQNLHCFKEPSQAMPRPRDTSPPPQTPRELL